MIDDFACSWLLERRHFESWASDRWVSCSLWRVLAVCAGSVKLDLSASILGSFSTTVLCVCMHVSCCYCGCVIFSPCASREAVGWMQSSGVADVFIHSCGVSCLVYPGVGGSCGRVLAAISWRRVLRFLVGGVFWLGEWKRGDDLWALPPTGWSVFFILACFCVARLGTYQEKRRRVKQPFPFISSFWVTRVCVCHQAASHVELHWFAIGARSPVTRTKVFAEILVSCGSSR